MKKQDENDVELFSSILENEIKQVCSLLEDNKIPFVRKDYGSGSYMNLYYGESLQEKKIFVNKKDYDKALEIVSSVFSNSISEDSNDEIEEDDGKKYYKIKDYFRNYILIMFFISIVVVIIVCLMNI